METNRPAQTVAAIVVSSHTIRTAILKFDASTEEFANGQLELPSTLDLAGSVTFRVYCAPQTGAASKNTGWTFWHRAVAATEAIGGAYAEEDSGAQAIPATSEYQGVVTWTRDVATLGWVAGDIVYFRISRDPSVANNLSGDCYFIRLTIELPTTDP